MLRVRTVGLIAVFGLLVAVGLLRAASVYASLPLPLPPLCGVAAQPPCSVVFDTAASTALEAGGAHNVLVRLVTETRIAVPVTADVVDAGTGSATSGADYTAFGTQTVTFPVGSVDGATQPVTLTVLDDSLPEADETVDLAFANVTGGAEIGTPAAHTVTILDDDRAVDIDIKPGSDPNGINTKSRGTIPVAILSTPDFDAPNQVDKTLLTFGRTGDELSLAKCTKSAEDVNGDGLLDLVCHFNTQDTGFRVGDTVGMLHGQTTDGRTIEGSDSVRIVR